MPYINVNDIKMFYKIFSGGKEVNQLDTLVPTLIVLHGGPGVVDHRMEAGFWHRFSRYLQVILPDQRGCGLSDDGNTRRWNLTQCGEDVYALANLLGIKQPIVAGVSWGGYVAMSYVTKHPNHPLAVILANAEAKTFPDITYQLFEKLGGQEAADAALAYWQDPEDPEKFDAYLELCIPFFSHNRFEFVTPAKFNMAMRIKFVKEENLTFDFRQQLANVQCPVLLLAGAHDPLHPLPSMQETAASIPEHLRNFRVIEDAGTPVYLDQPDKVYKTCVEFIKQTLLAKKELAISERFHRSAH